MGLFHKDFFDKAIDDEFAFLGKSSGQLLTESTNGELLVDGTETYNLAQTHKNDLHTMMRCCDSELKKMDLVGLVAAPFYFERVAILARKDKNYSLEIEIIERYISSIGKFYNENGLQLGEGVMAGPRYKAIEGRLSKAHELLLKNP
ncbi:hypothetical protein [Enterobacter hormaechei]|uniref:hypothetical protein n=1 Tax=Enterobacter hormaechei TaxID=158836 RepID=UPI00287F2036|nr:hypothetical protein [Enterobacter hormaechei]MDS6675157.1 hypothetical protein [Enterobacter hormaechei]MDS6706508.1 hypothetical protein [Enterobacter hormaechei]